MIAADAAQGIGTMKSFTIYNETNSITIYAAAAEAKAVPDAEYFASEGALEKLAANWPAARLIEAYNSLPGETPAREFKDRATGVSRIWKANQRLGEALPPEQPADVPVVETPGEVVAAEPEAEQIHGPEPETGAPVAPHTPDAAPEEAPATNDATSLPGAPVAADKGLLRLLARDFKGLTPEQTEEKWDALKNALATLKPAEADNASKTGSPREGSKTNQVIAMLKREGGATLEEIMGTMQWQQHTTRAILSAGGSLVKKHGLVVISEKVGDKRVYSIKA